MASLISVLAYKSLLLLDEHARITWHYSFHGGAGKQLLPHGADRFMCNPVCSLAVATAVPVSHPHAS